MSWEWAETGELEELDDNYVARFVLGGRRQPGSWSFERKLKAGLIVAHPLAPLFAFSNLFDDVGREHRATSKKVNAPFGCCELCTGKT